MPGPNPLVDLTTLADVKVYLGITDSSSDVLLQQLITAASDFAATYCSMNFIQATYTTYHNGTGGNVLTLPNTPITAVTSVSIGGAAAIKPRVFSPAQDGYAFDDFAIYLIGWGAGCGGIFPSGPKNVQVTYTAGYPSSSIPYDLAQAVIELVALKYKRRINIDVLSRTIAGEMIMYVVSDMNEATRTIFDQYKRTWMSS